jgi:hypothetical protein
LLGGKCRLEIPGLVESGSTQEITWVRSSPIPKGCPPKIAKVVEVPVPTLEAETPAEMKTGPVTAVEKTGGGKAAGGWVYTPPVLEP